MSIVYATNERPLFEVGDAVTIADRQPIGHYRVPTYLRGKRGTIEFIVEPGAVDNEEEGFGRNAGSRRHYYRLSIPLTDVWPAYAGSPRDALLIEIFESWLENAE